MIRVKILYDNTLWEKEVVGLKSAFGFSCLVETSTRRILFDTGGDGRKFLDNMRLSGIDALSVDVVFISHEHYDHMGGLFHFLEKNPAVPVYIPTSIQGFSSNHRFIRVDKPLEIFPNIYSTGELGRFEQSLIIKTKKGNIIIAGCSHPGVGEIIARASRFGGVRGIIGGLHGFDEFALIEDLEFVCPTHCTTQKERIEALYPDKFIRGGVGRLIEIDD